MATALLSLVVSPKTATDRESLRRGLQALTAEDPTLHVTVDPVSGDSVVGGVSELHLEIAVDRLAREFGVSAGVTRPQIVYTEAHFAETTFLLEPVMCVEIMVPPDHLDAVVADISERRGRVRSTGEQGGMWRVTAHVPLAGLFGYAAYLRDRTRGRGTFTMQLDQYEPVD